MVRYEIGPWEGGQKNGHTDKQTNRQRLANYNIDSGINIFFYVLFLKKSSVVR